MSGSGILILTGANTYGGGTAISIGSTLQLGNGGTTGSIAGIVVDNGLLVFSRSDNVSFGGVISGKGSVEQTGSGTTILSGTNSYSGGTTINAGALTVNNPQALGLSNVVVNGGMLNTVSQPIKVARVSVATTNESSDFAGPQRQESLYNQERKLDSEIFVEPRPFLQRVAGYLEQGDD